MNMKKIYEAPTSELIYIATTDIITASQSLIDNAIDNFGDALDIKIG